MDGANGLSNKSKKVLHYYNIREAACQGKTQTIHNRGMNSTTSRVRTVKQYQVWKRSSELWVSLR